MLHLVDKVANSTGTTFLGIFPHFALRNIGKQPLSEMISYQNTVDHPCATTFHKRTPIQDIKLFPVL